MLFRFLASAIAICLASSFLNDNLHFLSKKPSFVHGLKCKHCLQAGKQNPENSNPLAKFPWVEPPAFLKKVSFPSLIAGIFVGSVFTVLSIFSPLFFGDESISRSFESTEAEKIAEPVTLFQDILVDLNNDYVDKIDTAKLFKTGIKAMLKSLDPYTEFEDLEAAKSMQESVSGKYGGVGLVISSRVDSNPVGTLKKEPKKDLSITDSVVAPPEKEKSKGVSVVDAFEGYAYDAGIRVGDRILSVDGVDTTQMNVEQVRDLLRGDPDTQIAVEVLRDEGAGGKPTVEKRSLKRQLVKISDVRIATLLGKPGKTALFYNYYSKLSSNTFRGWNWVHKSVRI